MTRSKPITFLVSAAVIPLTALAVAACGGGGATAANPPAKPSTAKTATAARVTVVRVANSRLGRILINPQGHTLYLFKGDSGTRSACSGACATAWPPLLASGKPTAGHGASAALLGTIRRPDGTRQVTYKGHPLYLFVKDHKPGDTNGQGVVAFGAAWFALSPSGNQISSRSARRGRRSSSSRPVTPTAPRPAPQPAPPPAAKPVPPPAAKPVPPPATKPAPPASNGIPQNGGGDGDSDNNGGPSDGDGNV